MELFDLLSIKPAFIINESALKKAFLLRSREWHPDFWGNASKEEQIKAQLMTSMLNKAYTTLSDDHKRWQYLLNENGRALDGQKVALPQDFLMEMMDVNLAIEDAKLEGDDLGSFEKILSEYENEIKLSSQSYMQKYDNQENVQDSLDKLEELYLKNKYLLRIRENINNFADL